MSARVAVVLSGCGFKDGSEIHESVLTLLALDRAGASVSCFAPNITQAHVVNHLTGEVVEAPRNVLEESARIARGEVVDLAEANVADFDALILPGGFGAATSLCTFASEGAQASVDPEVARFVRDMHAAGKVLGAICIAPALVAAILGMHGPTLTIGTDAGTADAVESCGAKHKDCPVDQFVVDEVQRIVSTPAYMLGPSIRHVAEGIDRCVSEVLRLVGSVAHSPA